MKLLVVTLPHSNARYCVAMFSERSECPCAGLRAVFEQIGRAPALIVLDNATEAGRMVRGEVTESALFSRFRAHYRCESRYCNPYSGNEKGSVENAVGFLRRNLLVPAPSAASLAELNAMLRLGCERINASSRCRDGRAVAEALAEDLAAMMALPGVPFDAVRWVAARADKRGYVAACGNLYCAGPSWHGRELLVGLRAESVELLADRGRRVAVPPRSWGEGETVRNPASLNRRSWPGRAVRVRGGLRGRREAVRLGARARRRLVRPARAQGRRLVRPRRPRRPLRLRPARRGGGPRCPLAIRRPRRWWRRASAAP